LVVIEEALIEQSLVKLYVVERLEPRQVGETREALLNY